MRKRFDLYVGFTICKGDAAANGNSNIEGNIKRYGIVYISEYSALLHESKL